MKKRIILINTFFLFTVVLLMNSFIGNAQQKQNNRFHQQEAAFHKGSKVLSIGLGTGITYNYYGSSHSLPAFFLAYDHGIINGAGPGNIGIGGVLAMKAATFHYANGGYRADWRNYFVGARATWHLSILAGKNNKFDPYAGVSAGVRISKYRDTYFDLHPAYYVPYDDQRVNPFAGGFIGAKYNFRRFAGVFAEAGYDISLFRAGISFNF